jgi:hypothetical protein
MYSVRISVGTTDKAKKLRGLSPRANYTDRATAACRDNGYSAQSHHSNSGILFPLCQDVFLPDPLQFIISYVIRLCMVSSLEAPVSNLRKQYWLSFAIITLNSNIVFLAVLIPRIRQIQVSVLKGSNSDSRFCQK